MRSTLAIVAALAAITLPAVVSAQVSNPLVWPANGISSHAGPGNSLSQEMDFAQAYQLNSYTLVVNDGNEFFSPNEYILTFRFVDVDNDVVLHEVNVDLGAQVRPNQFPDPNWWETITFDPPLQVTPGHVPN